MSVVRVMVFPERAFTVPTGFATALDDADVAASWLWAIADWLSKTIPKQVTLRVIEAVSIDVVVGRDLVTLCLMSFGSNLQDGARSQPSLVVANAAEIANTYCNTVNRKLNVKNRQTTVNLWDMGTWDHNSTDKMMERETGIEPATSSLGSWRSTAELLPLTNKAQR